MASRTGPRRRRPGALRCDDTVGPRLGRHDRGAARDPGGRGSGDKGGNANLGLWVDSDDAYRWLCDTLDPATLAELVDGAAGLEIDRYEFENLRALNFVIQGLLGWGVASNLRLDTQAKSLGEEVRARRFALPVALIDAGAPAARLARWRAGGH